MCDERVVLCNKSLMQHICDEARARADPLGTRWALFARNSPHAVGTGSLLRLAYRSTRDAKHPTTFFGVLLAVRRSVCDPSIVVRGIVDGLGVEQVFCIFSPLIERIDVLKPAATRSCKKLYALREKPAHIFRLQKQAMPNL